MDAGRGVLAFYKWFSVGMGDPHIVEGLLETGTTHPGTAGGGAVLDELHDLEGAELAIRKTDKNTRERPPLRDSF